MSRMSTEIGRVLGGRYRIVAPIGVGGSAQVFLADDNRLRRRVAVKMLHEALAADPDFRRRFRAEAQAAGALSHPNVVAVFDWDDDDAAYIVTEFLGGGSLRAMLDRGALLTPRQAAAVAGEAASGLDYAHGRGFVHRDIKPANLLFGEDSRLRVADFGLARALAEAAWTEPQGAMLGTARYASPEQARGEQLTARSDVYSLALVVVEAVTGEVPFAADTTFGTLMARVDRPLVVPEALGPLREVLELAGHPDPAVRIDARTLAAGLDAAARDLGAVEPLPLAGALPPDASVVDDADDTVHAAPTQPDDSVVVDLRDDDADLDPPSWVTGGGAGAPANPEPDRGPWSTSGPDGGGPGTAGDGRRRRRWPWLLLAVLALGAAATVAVVAVRNADSAVAHDVPDLRGRTVAAARETAARFRWRVATTAGRRTGSTPGDIIGTRPAAGDRLAEGGLLTLVISQGNELVRLPPRLAGSALAAAEASLTSAGLRSVVQNRNDEQVPPGQVIAVTDEAGGRPPDQLPSGSAVTLVVSSGPAPRTIPTDLVGMPEAQARAALAAVQLSAGPSTSDFSDTVPEGAVAATSPAAGTAVSRDSAVTLVVSKGPDLVTVPSVRTAGSISQAIALLRQAGLTPGNVSGPATGAPRATSPAAGQRVKRGRTVNIALG